MKNKLFNIFWRHLLKVFYLKPLQRFIIVIKMASDAVLKYLEETNRPYSCADVTVNLRGAYTKGAVQKALDGLSEGGKIKCKLYGKQKVYAAIQQDDTTTGDNDLEDCDTQIQTLTKELSEKTNALRTAEITLKTLTSTPTTESANSQIEVLKEAIKGLEIKLKTLSTSKDVISVEEKKSIMDEHDKLLKEYRKRKRICTDMLDVVLENYPKSKKTFLEELCIETDELVGFKILSNT